MTTLRNIAFCWKAIVWCISTLFGSPHHLKCLESLQPTVELHRIKLPFHGHICISISVSIETGSYIMPLGLFLHASVPFPYPYLLKLQMDHTANWSIKVSIYYQDGQKGGMAMVIGSRLDTEMWASRISVYARSVGGNRGNGNRWKRVQGNIALTVMSDDDVGFTQCPYRINNI